MAHTLRLKAVPASAGTSWVLRGFRTFAMRPLGFAAMFAAFLFFSLLLLLIPLAGSVLAVMSLPLLTLGFMVATRAALNGEPAGPAQFVEPLRGHARIRGELLKLCAAYGVATVLLFLLCDVFDGGAFDRLMTALARGEPERQEIEQLLADPRVQAGVWLRLACTALLALPFWHAPALVYWGGQGAAQALFSSTLACWRAKGAFIVYGVSWVGVMLAFGLLTTLAFAVLGVAGLAGVAALPGALLFSTVFYVSLFFTFADCFEAAEAPSHTGHVTDA